MAYSYQFHSFSVASGPVFLESEDPGRVAIYHQSSQGTNNNLMLGHPEAEPVHLRRVSVNQIRQAWRCDFHDLLCRELWFGDSGMPAEASILTVSDDDLCGDTFGPQPERGTLYSRRIEHSFPVGVRWERVAEGNAHRVSINIFARGAGVIYNTSPNDNVTPIGLQVRSSVQARLWRHLAGPMITEAIWIFSAWPHSQLEIYETVEF